MAHALDLYFGLVPPRAIVAIQEPFMDPITGSDWSPFDHAARQKMFGAPGTTPDDEEDFNLVLSATLDGQAGDHGVRFCGINFDLFEDVEEAESVLRLDFPWNWVKLAGAAGLLCRHGGGRQRAGMAATLRRPGVRRLGQRLRDAFVWCLCGCQGRAGWRL